MEYGPQSSFGKLHVALAWRHRSTSPPVPHEANAGNRTRGQRYESITHPRDLQGRETEWLAAARPNITRKSTTSMTSCWPIIRTDEHLKRCVLNRWTIENGNRKSRGDPACSDPQLREGIGIPNIPAGWGGKDLPHRFPEVVVASHYHSLMPTQPSRKMEGPL